VLTQILPVYKVRIHKQVIIATN